MLLRPGKSGKKGALFSVAPYYAAGTVIPPAPGEVWSPTDKNAAVTISNGGLTATGGAPTSYTNGRSTVSRSTGKQKWEVHVDAFSTSSGYILVGIDDGRNSLSNYLGGDTVEAWGYWTNQYLFWHGGPQYTGPSYGNGDTVMIAEDHVANKLYIGKNGVWANGDPSAGTGGQTINSASYFAAYTCSAVTSQITARFTAASQTYPMPTGYTGRE